MNSSEPLGANHTLSAFYTNTRDSQLKSVRVTEKFVVLSESPSNLQDQIWISRVLVDFLPTFFFLIMEWSEEILLKLIRAYRNKRLLWDQIHKNHYRKNLKANAWKEISDEINTSVVQCQKKMLSLLSSYRRERRKVRSSMGTGKRRVESRWFGYEAFKFLEDKDLPKKGHRVETDKIIKVEDDIEAEVMPLYQMEREATQTEQETIASTTASSTSRSTKRPRENGDVNSSMMTNALNVLQTTAKNLEKDPSEPNEIDAFFTYVVAKVHKYSPEAQKKVQHAVFDILMQADRGMLDYSTPPIYSETYLFHPHQVVPHPATASQCRPSFLTKSAEESPAASISSENFEDFVGGFSSQTDDSDSDDEDAILADLKEKWKTVEGNRRITDDASLSDILEVDAELLTASNPTDEEILKSLMDNNKCQENDNYSENEDAIQPKPHRTEMQQSFETIKRGYQMEENVPDYF
ncbi:hypothetical protein AVEN_48482-1 [Araneus ventricosus]|uniref:MADF domain-containing protein n=1 Tax=Araneus ventricosus TaxID=182803 RepID=A0A4Y2FD03_ARAVE|nr:hypothetical protein AVEN_48482-1 [Araneus ventricosus]